MNAKLNDTFIEKIGTRILVMAADSEILLSENDLEWNEYQLVTECLTLEEIANQCTKKFGQSVVIHVWTEIGVSGVIYQYGNHGAYWDVHGKTRGYA